MVAMLAVAGAGIYFRAPSLLFRAPSLLRAAEHQPPLNTVMISDALATSGQPSAAQLQRLHAQGHTAVINLAPPGRYGRCATNRSSWRRPACSISAFRSISTSPIRATSSASALRSAACMDSGSGCTAS